MSSLDILELMKHAAATAILPRWKDLSEAEIHEKKPGDLVTVADTDAEKIIARELRAAFPDAVVLGEEGASADPTLIERFYTAEHSFTIDPVDGTANFVNGSQDFAVMIAEIKNGETVRAWIWQPAHGASYTAEKGAGAYRNTKRMKVRKVKDDDPAAWRGITNRKALKKQKFKPLSRMHSGWWSTGIDYPNIAMGRSDFVVYKHVMPWDHAPGQLILSEVGGQLIRADGSPYSPTAEVSKWLIGGTGDIPTQVLPYLSEAFLPKDAELEESTEPEDLLKF